VNAAAAASVFIYEMSGTPATFATSLFFFCCVYEILFFCFLVWFSLLDPIVVAVSGISSNGEMRVCVFLLHGSTRSEIDKSWRKRELIVLVIWV
jgi:hypothetical protein